MGLTTDAHSKGGTLYVNEIKVLELSSTIHGKDPAERAQILVNRLAGRSFEGSFYVEIDGKSRNILLDGKPLVVVTPEEAKALGAPVEVIATRWVKNFKKAISAPPYYFEGAPQIKIVEGQSKSIEAYGSHFRKAAIFASPTGIVKVSRKTGSLQLDSLQAGVTTLSFRNNGVTGSLLVKVIPLAAKFPQTVSAQIMGLPPEPTLFQNVVSGAIRQNLVTLSQNASITIGDIKQPSIRPGESTEIQVPVRVTSPGHAPAEGSVTVALKNMGVGIMYEDLLWYSNVPENVREPGQLYFGQFQPDRSVRLLIHHCNRTNVPMMFAYTLINRGATPATLTIVNGDVAGDGNPTFAGYLTGISFFKRWLSHSAQIVTIPPQSVLPLFIQKAGAEETVSGLSSIHLQSSASQSDVSLVAHAMWKGDFSPIWADAVGQTDPWNFVKAQPVTSFNLPTVEKPKEIYPDPNRRIEFQYEVGGSHTFIRIGQEPLGGIAENSKLLGNFGANYIIKGDISNPTNAPAEVEIVFEASAGYSGAFFRVNGQLKDGRLLQAKERMDLLKVKLDPGQSKPITIETIPLSGAHYPATIIIQPAEFR